MNRVARSLARAKQTCVLASLACLTYGAAPARADDAPYPRVALTETPIQIDLGRAYGLISPSAAVLRAVSIQPAAKPSKTALLFFVGWPGILWLPENPMPNRFIEISKRNAFYAITHLGFFPSQDIAFVLVDCPTDQWGSEQRTPDPQGCSDAYRSSPQHADDVKKLIAHLRRTQGIEQVYVMGHSYGSVSSRWLAIRLGNEIQGSIHSASMSQAAGARFPDYGSSVSRMDMSQASAPWVYLHNQQDQCRNTAYAPNLEVAGPKMITVRGGSPEGDPCGGGHYHSYRGRELEVLQAVARWIRTGDIVSPVGEP